MKIFRSLIFAACLLCFGGEAFCASFGWNFRDTIPFVSDPVGTTYVVNQGGGFGEVYPTTRNGITFGWTVQPGNLRDRDAGLDPRLAGNNFGTGIFRVDLPFIGTWAVDLALGDAGGGATDIEATILDNVSTVDHIGPTTTSSGQFVDATGVTRANAAAWVAAHPTKSLAFATTAFFIRLDRSLTSIAHLTLSSGVADTDPPTAPTSPAATVISSQQISLGWTNGTDNVSIINTRIERCPGTGCTTWAEVGTSTGTTFSSTGLTPDTLYRFRFRHFDGTNLGPYSSIVQGQTLPARQATVTWVDTVNTDHTGYILQRRTLVGTFADIATIGTATIRQYIDPDSPQLGGCYRLRAIRTVEEGPQSSEACTSAVGSTPSPPTGFKAANPQ